MDAGRVGRLRHTPMMKPFNQLLAKQLSPGVFASLDPRLSAGNLSGCRFPAGPRWPRRSTTHGTRRM